MADAPAQQISFCMVTTFYPPANFGGDGIHVRRLARALASHGHRVRVVHSPAAYRLLARHGADTPADEPGVEVVAVPGGQAAAMATYLSGGSARQRRALDDLAAGFDVVHFHNPSLLGGPRAFDLGEGVRLYTTHEHWLLCPTHVLFRYGREVCTRRTCVSCTLSYRRPPQPWRATSLLETAVAELDVLLCPSRFTAGLHRQHFPTARIEVLPLPGPEAAPHGPEPGADGQRPYFLFAGRLEPVKGAARLVAAFPRVEGADLVVAGTGSEDARLRALAGDRLSIRFLGELPHDEVIALCRGARAVVVPSAGYETFGGVAVEAMAVGTPAVVADFGPLPELVEAGGGLTFGDDDELVAGLQRLVDDPADARRLGSEARRVAAERFGEDLFLKRYFGIIAEAADASDRPALARRATLAASAPRP